MAKRQIQESISVSPCLGGEILHRGADKPGRPKGRPYLGKPEAGRGNGGTALLVPMAPTAKTGASSWVTPIRCGAVPQISICAPVASAK